jgi:hypothetical protein
VIRATRSLLAVVLLTAICAVLGVASATAATKAPAWQIESYAAPTNFVPDLSSGQNMYVVTATNIGGAPTDGSPVTVTIELPAGFSFHSEPIGLLEPGISNGLGATTPCTDGTPIVCQLDQTVVPGERIYATIPVDTPASGPAIVSSEATVSGAGMAPASIIAQAPFNADSVPFGIQNLATSLTDVDGAPATQAGAHPYSFRFAFNHNSEIQSDGDVGPVENIKNVTTKLPPGLVVNPAATPRCTEAQLGTLECPNNSAVGIISYRVAIFGFPSGTNSSVIYNMVPAPDTAASFGFNAVGQGFFFHILGDVDAANGYALKADVSDITQFGGLSEATVDLWGDPSDPAHDQMRCGFNVCSVPLSDTPLLTMPTSCSDSLTASLELTSWQTGAFDSASTVMKDADGNTVGVSGCGALDFQPTLKARPTTNVADSPSGLEVDLQIPQTNSQSTLATAHLKKAVVTLPEGITINPGAGNGLEACSSSQIGLLSPIGQTPIRFSEERPSCPNAAKLGTVQVSTPVLDNALPGAVYIAKPFDNPFNSFLAIYIVVDDPQTGLVVKLAGKVQADPNTGQLTTTFDDNPQLPFAEFKLDFFGGATGALRTPVTCGDYSTTSELTPWSAPDSGPPATPQDDYTISQSPSGACASSVAQLPNSPSFDAGTVSPIAATNSPFVVHLRRADATQQFSAISVSPPPGLVAKLAGTAICPEASLAAAAQKSGNAEKANPSCPAASRVGTVVAGAGAGPAPYYAPGSAYLAGPYKGAPLSIAIITPATAGPFDLGTVVVKTAVYVDAKTAKVTAIADPLPTILEGIPLDVRTIDLALDKPGFTLNGTSCEPSAVTGQLTTTLGQITPLQSRFQLGDCTALGFKPKLTLRLKGGTKRGKHPALTAVLETRPGDANIAAASVALPRSEFLDQAHIGTVCTRVQFAADQCPAASIYGTATVTTPLLDYPLSGNVYLRSSDNKLPDLVPDLRGPAYQPLRLEAAGRTDSIKGGLRNTFDFVPDAPFTKFTLQLFGGKKGLLQNSTNICKELNKATAKYTAHNGDTYEAKPVLKADCKKARKGKKRKGSKGSKGAKRG